MKESEKDQGAEPVSVGFGEMLRLARERQNLSYEELFEITRLRESVIRALENEAWDQLPSPVFVRGFIKSYARAVGLEESEALRAYDKHAPQASSVPKPLLESEKSKVPWVIFVSIAGLVAALLFFYWGSRGTEPPFETKTKSETSLAAKPIENQREKKKSKGETGAVEPNLQLEGVGVSSETIISEKSETSPEPKAPTSYTGQEKQGTGESPLIPQSQESSESFDSKEEKTPALILKGLVKERTWMRVIVDDKEPKEYIFNPGSQPQWEAADNFDIMIGNASGIELEFNGKGLGPLGPRGKVVHLRLPKE